MIAGIIACIFIIAVSVIGVAACVEVVAESGVSIEDLEI